jgi:hypothetical protein
VGESPKQTKSSGITSKPQIEFLIFIGWILSLFPGGLISLSTVPETSRDIRREISLPIPKTSLTGRVWKKSRGLVNTKIKAISDIKIRRGLTRQFAGGGVPLVLPSPLRQAV